MTPTHPHSFIRIHLSKGNVDTVHFLLDEGLFSYKGYMHQSKASGAGTYSLITERKVKEKKIQIYLNYKGYFKGTTARSGKGLFYVSTSEGKRIYYKKFVILEKQEPVVDLLLKTLKEWKEEKDLLKLK